MHVLEIIFRGQKAEFARIIISTLRNMNLRSRSLLPEETHYRVSASEESLAFRQTFQERNAGLFPVLAEQDYHQAHHGLGIDFSSRSRLPPRMVISVQRRASFEPQAAVERREKTIDIVV